MLFPNHPDSLCWEASASPAGLCLGKIRVWLQTQIFCFLKPKDLKPKLCNLEPPVVLVFGILRVLDSLLGCVSFSSRASYLGLAGSRPLVKFSPCPIVLSVRLRWQWGSKPGKLVALVRLGGPNCCGEGGRNPWR